VADVAADPSRELENLREQQRALGDVLRAVAQSAGLQPVLDEVVEAATRLCEGDNGRLWLLQDGLLHAVSNGGVSEGFDYDRQHPHALDETTMSGRAALARRPVHLPDVLDDPTYAYSGPKPFRANLSVPILFEDDLIGVIGLVRRAPEPFTEQQIQLVQAFADQAAIAIKNARLIDAVERQLDQQRAIGDVLRAVARSEGLDAVFHTVVESAARLCEAEYGEVHLADGDVLRLAVGHGGAPELYEYEREHPHARDESTVTGRVALTRQVVHIPDIDEDPGYTYAGPRTGYRTLLAAPILVEENLIGVFSLARDTPRPFTDEQIDLVKTFADQAAIAIANARLIEAVERQLEQQRAFSDVLGVVARSEGLASVFNAVVEAAARLCEAEYGQVHVADGDLFRLAGDYGAGVEISEFERQHPNRIDRTTVVGRVGLTREVVHLPDVLEDPEYSWPGQQIAGYRSMLGVPIFVDDELIGVINVVRNEPRPFTEEQIELVKTFADQAAIAIANARLIDAVERQRSELSRFVSPQVAELVSSDEGEHLLAGHRAYISSMFCDLRGFTSFTELAEPEELFEVLREYHVAIGELIPAYEGTLEHFAGDGLMVFFNDPLPVEDHELKAIRLALAAQERFSELAEVWRKRGTELGLGIGIAAGYATLGRIGFEGRYDYGALGTVTNLASRLSTQAEPGQTLISQRVFAAAEDAVEAEMVGEVELKGFGRPVVAYEVRGLVESGA
jgi:GAF domain-containing protein